MLGERSDEASCTNTSVLRLYFLVLTPLSHFPACSEGGARVGGGGEVVGVGWSFFFFWRGVRVVLSVRRQARTVLADLALCRSAAVFADDPWWETSEAIT